MVRSSLALWSVVAVASVAPAAHADPRAAADRTFEQGRALMAKKQYAEACVAFEQSQRLDPQLGTLFNLAECDTQLGMVTAAWKMYRELAQSDPNLDRRRLSAEAAAQLEPKLPRLLIAIAAPPPGMSVQIDGADVTALVGEATPVDPGEHAIVVRAPGYVEWEKTRAATLGKTSHVRVVLVRAGEVPVASEPAPDAPPPAAPTAPDGPDGPDGPDASASRAHHGKLALAIGGGTVGAGLVLGGVAYGLYHSADDCSGCTGDQRRDRSHDAVVLGDVSTVAIIVGLIPAAAGLYLWHTAGSSAVIVPQVSGDGAGAVVMGRF